MTTTADAVQKIAHFMSMAENRANISAMGARAARDDFKAIADNRSAPSLTTMALSAELVAMTARHSAELLGLHVKLTEAAKAYDIDLPAAPETHVGEVSTLGGGDR